MSAYREKLHAQIQDDERAVVAMKTEVAQLSEQVAPLNARLGELRFALQFRERAVASRKFELERVEQNDDRQRRRNESIAKAAEREAAINAPLELDRGPAPTQ